MKRGKGWLSGVLAAAMVASALSPVGTVYGKQPAVLSQTAAKSQVDSFFGVKTDETGSKKKATYDYVASVMSKDSSIRQKELLGSYTPKKTVSETGLKKLLKKRFPNVVTKSTTVTKKGNVLIKKAGVTLKNTHVRGNLVIAESVGKGAVTLSNVTVDKLTVVRGGGENSINVTGQSSLSRVILQNEKRDVTLKIAAKAKVDSVVVEEKSKNVILKGAAKNVTVKGADVGVTLQEAKIDSLQVYGKRALIHGTGSNHDRFR